MASRKDRAVLRQVRTLFDVGAVRELTDGQLLERFAAGRGEAAELAFAALVERHGPMVLRVCRGVLADPHETQDAFQATFLVLVRKARGLWVRDSLGPWLHQVALRTAACARSAAARRRRLERAAGPREEPAAGSGAGAELEGALHAEIDRLPERYRVPIVLCDLEGRSHEQAARHLGWPVGTVKSRQARGRRALRDRLVRRGLAPTAGLAAVLAAGAARAAVPDALTDATTSAAVRSAAGGAAATLAREVLKAMSLTRWLQAASKVLVLAATATAATGFALSGAAGGQPAKAGAGDGKAKAPQVVEVKPGPFRVTLVERGNVQAARSADVYSLVEGPTRILSIVPEGTRVQKGQLVCELDSARLKDRLTNQVIITKRAETAYRNAEVVREVAEIAADGYAEGTARQEAAAIDAAAALAESSLRRAESALERTRRARQKLTALLDKKGADPTAGDVLAELSLDDRLELERLNVEKAKLEIEQARTRRMIHDKYDRPIRVKELRAAVERERAKELEQQAAWELERLKEERLLRQIAACTLRAPADGNVVHANDPNRAGTGPPQIREGATIGPRQKVFSLPDLSALAVLVKVHESVVDQVVPGQPVDVTVDAIPGERLTGKVTSVAPLPDPSAFIPGVVKVYSTLVALDGGPAGLRPGMTARAEIVVADVGNVLTVPVGAVATFDGKDHLAVKTAAGGFDWREVALGKSDGKVVEVKSGLTAGESVAVDPVDLMTEDQKRARDSGPSTRPRGRAGTATKTGRAAVPPEVFRKFQDISPEDRARMRGASPAEREAILKKAGFTEAEVREFEARRAYAPPR